MKYTESAWQLASAFMASNKRFGHNPTEVLAEAITKRDAEKDAEIERLKAENAELRREIGGFSHLSDMRQCMVDAADETERLRKALDQVLQVTGITREYKRVSAIYHPKPLVWLSVPSINGNGGGFRFSVNLDAAAPELAAYLREKEANHGN